MYPESGTESGTCPDNNGILPACAPLAVPYVPRQQPGSRRYNRMDALENGTLFPGLNLPFYLKAEAPSVSGTPLAELQALEFVLVELGLYLDTHPDDQEAFILFQQYSALEKNGRAKYEARFDTPLTQSSAAEARSYQSWTQDPWPWNYEEGSED